VIATAKTIARFGSREVKLSNLDKKLYPEAGFTKRDVIDYYTAIAPVMLPHIKGRAISLKRYPDGVNGKFFYQKNCPVHRPDWLETASVAREDESGEPVEYCMINDRAALIWMANLASLELHTQLAKAARIAQPTMMVFDLDPGPKATLLDCLRVGQQLREALNSLGLQCFAKTSGSKGLHVAVPLNRPVTFERTKTFAHALAGVLERQDPRRIITKMSRTLRSGKVFVDWSQNDQHKTTVCAYSLRARARPNVSTPVTWDEIDDAARKRKPERLVFEAADVLQRVAALGDPFLPVLKLKQHLPDAA
jgi:bifunctional non-homologous end joining protein LigD